MADKSESSTTLLQSVSECQVGMKVRHTTTGEKSRGAGDGEIVAIGSDGVHVHYSETGCDGIYDDVWFQSAGAILEQVRQ